jgi:hypothetical protein
MKKIYTSVMLVVMLMMASLTLSAQERRPIDSEHPLWLVHIDVWNSADPQKIIDLIPDDIKPYVCMNLSFSCQYDTGTNMYRMPRNAVRTYKSWASVCQANGMWFSCQPASGGKTHIQDNDLETFEYFFKAYPNFLGWNYAEQFWGFGEAGDKGSMTTSQRWALFANLVEMSHKYGGFLTVSWCGGIYHFDTDPIAELKLNKDFLEACKKYPEAILFLYKYTHCSSFYNNESVCWGPFISGLTKNYGVRYDNCGWNDMTSKIIGENKCKYPGSAGIGTVMEQTCVNGGAVWDGPELIWTEDFNGSWDTTVDGYTRRNWSTFDNFKGIWLDMWRKIIDGSMYIPSREEVVAKTQVVILHDSSNDFKVPDALYDGLYKQTDPGNPGDGRFGNNLCYFKKTGRYGAIPMVTGLYDDAAKGIYKQVKKSAYSSLWGNQTKKVNDFNDLYPEVSTGDLYVNRYKNQLVTYTPYTYLNGKKKASADIPLQYNTCETLSLTYGKLSSGIVREYADHIDFYLNNYRSDSTAVQTETIVVRGVTTEASHTVKQHTTGAKGQAATVNGKYNAEEKTYTVTVSHMGPVDVTINCTGDATERNTNVLPSKALETPKQPEPYRGPIIIEAENMDRKNANIALTNSGWWAQHTKDFAGMGYIETKANTNCVLRHQLKLSEGGKYNIRVRYANSNKAGSLKVTVNGSSQNVAIQKVGVSDWQEAVVTATLNAGTNTLLLQNTSAITMYIDQVTYEPEDCQPEKFLVTIRDADFGKVESNVESAAAGEEVKLTIIPEDGYAIKALKVVNSIFYTQDLSIPVSKDATEVTFTMLDDNMTIQPVFYDTKAVYSLDFTNVAGGSFPVGWRTTDGSSVRNYPHDEGTGPRTMAGFTGYQGKALYWRNTSAEYGRLSAYPLNLKVGTYELVYVNAAWKGSPSYTVNILKSTGVKVKSSTTNTASPNVNGNGAGDISTAKRQSITFDITEAGKYIIQFKNASTAEGMHEFLLAECRLRLLEDKTGIESIELADMDAGKNSTSSVIIYNAAGARIPELQPGVNIIRMADGKTRKVYVK